MSGNITKFMLFCFIGPAGIGFAQEGTQRADPALLDDKTWEKFDEEDGVQLYRRTLADGKLKEFRGVGVVDASIPKIITLLADAANLPFWVNDCVHGELIGRNFDVTDFNKEADAYQEIVYGINRMPWPLENRDYVVKSNVVFVPAGKERPAHALVQNFKTTDPAKPEQKGMVRMPQMNVFFMLTPVTMNLNKTAFDITISVDPGGMVPTWATNLAARMMPLKTVQALRELVHTSNYDKQMYRLVEYHFNRIILTH